MQTLSLAPIVKTSESRTFFLTPTGDYYTTEPLSLGQAHELIEMHVRRVVMPAEAHSPEPEALLIEAGIEISYQFDKCA